MLHFRVAPAVLAACLVLGGCATPYQPRGATGGYVEQKIDDNTYLVGFFGNGNTSRDAVFKMWLYRCADLTSQLGYDYFVVAGRPSRTSEDTRDRENLIAAGANADDAIPMRSGGGAPTYYYVPGGTQTIRTWSARAAIRMYKGEPPKGQSRAFRAREVLADLAPEVVDGQSAAVGAAMKYSPDIVFGSGTPAVGASAPSNSGPVPGDPGRGRSMDELKGLLPEAK